MKLTRWAGAALMVGFILTSIGVLPLWFSTTFFPGADPLLFALAFFLLTPLGVFILGFGALLWIIGKIRN